MISLQDIVGRENLDHFDIVNFIRVLSSNRSISNFIKNFRKLKIFVSVLNCVILQANL
jgi:hypothetical protein